MRSKSQSPVSSLLALRLSTDVFTGGVIVPNRTPVIYTTGLYTLERRRLRGDMIELFKKMKGRNKISVDELFNRVDGERTGGHGLRVKKRRVKTVVKVGDFHSE